MNITETNDETIVGTPAKISNRGFTIRLIFGDAYSAR